MKLIKLLWCKIVGHKVTTEVPWNHIDDWEIPNYRENDDSIEYYDICKRCGCEVNNIILYDCDDVPPDALINVKNVDEKPKFEVVDSAPRRFVTDRCVHKYEPSPYQKYRDIRVLKCKICGKIKKKNTRIKKPKQR